MNRARGNGSTSGAANRLFVTAVLLEAAMLTQEIAMVAGVDDQRAIRLARFLESRQHAADIAVEKRDRRVIRGGNSLFFLRGQVAKDGRDLPAVLCFNRGTRRIASDQTARDPRSEN